MKNHFKIIALNSVLVGLLFSSCYEPKHIVGDLDLNNLKPGIDSFRMLHPVIHNGDVVTLNIQNANKDLYTVKITPNVVSFNTAVPGALATALGGFVTPAAVSAGGSTARNFPPAKTDALYCNELIEQEKEKLKHAVALYKAAENNINKIIAYNNYLLLLQKDCGLSAVEIKKEADSALNKITAPYAQATGLGKFIQDNVAEADKNYRRVDSSLIKIDAWFNCDSCQKSIKANKVKNFTDNEKGRFGDIKDGYGKISAFEQTRQDVIIVQNYKAVTEPSNYTVNAIATAHFADEITFNIAISPKNWLPCRTVDTSFNINIKVARFKIDFSTGVFFNWGSGAFSGKNYFIDSTSRIRQIAKNSNTYIPSIGALIHFYYRGGGVIDPGLVVGASLAANAAYTNFHIGLSCIFNAHNEVFNRIALSGGLTYRYVNDLNNGYSAGTAVDKNLTIQQLESGKFISGGFIALTYNLSKN